MAVAAGKETRPDIHLGVCGEHGGDPASIEFFNEVGLNYVSCSPYRVPLARLAAAQAAIKLDRKNGVAAKVVKKVQAKKAAVKKAAAKKTAKKAAKK